MKSTIPMLRVMQWVGAIGALSCLLALESRFFGKVYPPSRRASLWRSQDEARARVSLASSARQTERSIRMIWPRLFRKRSGSHFPKGARQRPWRRLLVLEALESWLAPAFVEWTGPSGDWGTASNWSTGTVPGPNDDAFITETPAVTVTISSADNASVNSLTAYDELALTGGSLTVASKADLGRCTLTGGSTRASARRRSSAPGRSIRQVRARPRCGARPFQRRHPFRIRCRSGRRRPRSGPAARCRRSPTGTSRAACRWPVRR
jgi:hypothetical protein